MALNITWKWNEDSETHYEFIPVPDEYTNEEAIPVLRKNYEDQGLIVVRIWVFTPNPKAKSLRRARREGNVMWKHTYGITPTDTH